MARPVPLEALCGCLLFLSGTAFAEPAVLFVGEEEAPKFAEFGGQIRSALLRAGNPEILSWPLDQAMGRRGPLPESLRLIVALGTHPARWARDNRGGLPMVFGMVLNPQPDLVESLERPAPGIMGACLNLPAEPIVAVLRKLLPRVRLIGLLHTSRETLGPVREIEVVSARVGLECRAVAVDSPNDIEPALRPLLPAVDLVWALADSKVFTPAGARVVLERAMAARVPVLGYSKPMATAGALVAIYPDFAESANQAAELAAEALQKGAATVRPIARPTRPIVAVNRRVLDLLGLSLSEEASSLVQEWIQ
ncbi:MAG: hypothetical protein HYY25_09065 [Candidatus Wallbacteria bacterium]|nr:hypothetical protein [Candidatus Wallbacteria bacterium]